MNSIIFLMGSWNALSERFLYRQRKMLWEEGLLDCIVAANLNHDTTWKGIPIYGISDITSSDPAENTPDPEYQKERLGEVLARRRADTILCQYGTMAVLFAPVLAETSRRLFIHLHGKDSQKELHSPSYIKTLEGLSRRAVIVCSPHVRERLAGWEIPSGNIAVKNYGVEIPSDNIVAKKSGVEIPDQTVGPGRRDVKGCRPIRILYLGRFIDCKGPDKTIRAFETACENGLNGELVMAGDGPLKPVCEEMKSESKWSEQIHLPGFLPREGVDRLLRRADIFTQHSIKGGRTGLIEAFGVSVVEAMAHGLPVVSCSIGGIKYTVQERETGILVEPGDTAAQSEAFLALAENPELRLKMGRAGWERARKCYTYQKEKEKLISIIT